MTARFDEVRGCDGAVAVFLCERDRADQEREDERHRESVPDGDRQDLLRRLRTVRTRFDYNCTCHMAG